MPRLTYLGHSAFLLIGAGTALVIDPFLTGNPLAAKSAREIKVDWVILTHGHDDHLGDGLEIAKANHATIIAPFELAQYCAAKGVETHGMYIGGSYQFPFGRVKLTIAHHGSAVIEGGKITYTGSPCGILITMEGKTLYHSGDTGLFYDMKLIGEMNHIDVALLPIGDNFTMGIADAVKAAEFLQPAKVIPMHFNTFDLIKSNPKEFVDKVKVKGIPAQIMEFGASLDF